MGGTALPEGGKRHKRALDANVNVVPAIDLLSCCISFLLFTAVWTQIGRLQAQATGDGPPPETQPLKALSVTLTIGDQGYVLATSVGGAVEIPLTGHKDGDALYDTKSLIEKLEKLKKDYPDQSAVTVAASDAVKYADLVHAIDACVGAGLANISVMGAG